MLPKYSCAAMHKATYETLSDGSFYGEIPGFQGKPRKRAKGRVDHTLRIKVNLDIQPVAIGLIEAKAEHLPPPTDLSRPNSTPRIIVSAPPQMMQWIKRMTTNAYIRGVKQHAGLGF